MSKEIIGILEDVVFRAWREEKVFSKVFMQRKLKRNDSLCQGVSRNISNKIVRTFPDTKMIEFEVNKKTHIAVYMIHRGKRYILDGSIQQFLPKENKNVYRISDYPFKRELKKGKKWFA